MKRTTLLLLFIIPLFVIAQKDSLISGVYPWKEPALNEQSTLSSILFEGHTHDMAYLQMTTNSISNAAKIALTVPKDEEQLLIIQSGTVAMQLKDSIYTIGAGSVAVVLPGDTYALQNTGKDSCKFYLVRYRSRAAIDMARGKRAGGSFVTDWNKIAFVPNDKGGKRNFFERSTAMCKRMEMHVTTLNSDSTNHAPQTHRPAEFTIMKEGLGEIQVGPYYQELAAGNVTYFASNILQALTNIGPDSCTYFVIQFE